MPLALSCVLCYTYYTSEYDVLQEEKPMGLTRTNIYLDDKQLERLRIKSEKDNLPVSEIVRRAIDAYLAWDDPTYTPHPPPQKGRAFHPPHE
jgi:Ribbon-helix-helix protein, copG family